MRFDEINLKAVGHFSDYKIDFDPTKNFHLLYGSNEAGKSTTLRSINYLLYGFPRKTNDSFLHQNSKLRVAGSIRNKRGEKLEFARRKGNKDTVLDLNGQPMDEKLVEQFLQGVPESQFLNMFALNHERLREGGQSLLQSGGSAGESVFSAASGINMLRKILEQLDKEIGNLYKRTGSNPKLNQLLKQEKELKQQLRDVPLNAKAWKELDESYQRGQQNIEELYEKIKELHQSQRKLERMKQVLPKISLRQDLLQKINELQGIPSLPDNIKEIRTGAENQRNSAIKDIESLEEEIAQIEQQLKQLSIPAEILEQAPVIEQLYREVNFYQQNIRNLPNITAEIEQNKKVILSIMQEIDPSHARLENIHLYRLPAEKKMSLQELIQQKPRLDQQLEQLEKERKKWQKELEKKEEELKRLPMSVSIEKLVHVIDKVKRAGSIEENINKLEKQCQEEEFIITELNKELPLWKGTYQELAALSIPVLQETINTFEQERNVLLQQLEQVLLEMNQERQRINDSKESIRNLESLAEIPSEKNLLDARTMRDEGWKIIRSKLQSGKWTEDLEEYTKGQPIEWVYEENVRQADTIADTMRREAEKVGEKNKLLSDIAQSKQRINELEKEESKLQQQLQAWERNWMELWKPINIAPLSPLEMKEWFNKFESIKVKVQVYNRQVQELEQLKKKRDQLKEELVLTLSEYEPVSKRDTLVNLLNIADQQTENLRRTINHRENLQTRIRDIQNEIQEQEKALEELEKKMELWKTHWNDAIRGTSVSINTSVNVAQQIIDKHEQCIQSYDEYVKRLGEQQRIQENISRFEKNVKELVETLGETFPDQPYDMVMNRLYSRWQQASKDKVAFDSQREQLGNLQLKRKEKQKIWNEAETRLADLMKLASCQTVEELKEMEEKFLEKKSYLHELKKIEEEMLTLASGMSLQELLAEAKDYHIDDIDGKLEDIKHRLDNLEKERSEKEQLFGAIKKEYEEKIQGTNTKSVELEQKRNSLFSQIADYTDEYIQRKLASILLRKGIEDYRSRNQNPIIKRAGELFAKLTLRSFADLTVDYDEKDEPKLMGVRENGERVRIEGMSDGTTDQLYLALRIASIEKYVSESEPIPFIVDDILVHFDDERSKETLKVLLELSKHTQVIFFTHHFRLTEIMEEITDESRYQLIEISQKEVVSLAN